MVESGNPFDTIKQIDSANELLDIAFSRANRVRAPAGKMSNLERSKAHEINRINMISSIVTSRLEFVVQKFPSINLLHPFYRELGQILSNLDEIKLSLGRINGAVNTIANIQESITLEIQSSNSKDDVKISRKRFYGRIASVLQNIDSSLIFMKDAVKKLQTLPSFNPTIPCVVMSGFPNTGKSSFIKLATSGKPEIASYPFTTKKLIFGHRNFGFIPIQFVDTPGILDRPLSQRNSIELQAITAFKFLADILFFLIDPSTNAEASIDSQINLFKEIQDYYPELKVHLVLSKSDLLSSNQLKEIESEVRDMTGVEQIFKISTVSESGISEIINHLSSELKLILRQPKYRGVRGFEIAEDQKTIDQLEEFSF